MKFIDTHSHLFLDEFADDLASVIERAQAAGVFKIVMPNIDITSIKSMMQVADSYPSYCYPTLGLHPTSVKSDYREQLNEMRTVLKDSNRFVAIGEVGIDLYWDATYKKEQIEALEEQIQWSLDYNIPLIIHSREAYHEIYTAISNFRNEPISGIFHSFGGTLEEAESLLGIGNFKLGINGVVTFKKSNLPEVLVHIPLDKIVLETDSPYLAPVPNRGKRNESAYLKNTLQKMAEIYQISSEELAKTTTQNAINIFKTLF